MLNRRLRNKLYYFLQSKKTFIDLTAQIGSDTFVKNSEIHGKVIIGNRSTVFGSIISGDIKIGSNTSLWGPNIHVLAHNNKIEIGNFCSIARDVTIQEYFHDYNKLTTYFIERNVFGGQVENESISKGDIIIGHDVWIGTGVQIMSGITIGNGAVIAANSTVTKDIPPYSIAGGVPAKVIKYRFNSDEINILQKLEWWNWDIEKIKLNKELFIMKPNFQVISEMD